MMQIADVRGDVLHRVVPSKKCRAGGPAPASTAAARCTSRRRKPALLCSALPVQLKQTREYLVAYLCWPAVPPRLLLVLILVFLDVVLEFEDAAILDVIPAVHIKDNTVHCVVTFAKPSDVWACFLGIVKP